MKKIVVIGSPGAGKSVFSRKLGKVTGLPLYHLDMLYHNEDGTHTDICIAGAQARIGTKRDDLPWIEKEFDESFKKCIMDFSKEKLPQIYEILSKYRDKKKIIIFKSREDADKYIDDIE